MVESPPRVALKAIVALAAVVFFAYAAEVSIPDGDNIRWWIFKDDTQKITEQGGEIFYITCYGGYTDYAKIPQIVFDICKSPHNNPPNAQRAVHRIDKGRAVFMTYHPQAKKVKYIIYDLEKIRNGETDVEKQKLGEEIFDMKCDFNRRFYDEKKIRFDVGFLDPNLGGPNGKWQTIEGSTCNNSTDPFKVDIFDDGQRYKLKSYYNSDYQLYHVENEQFFFTIDTYLAGLGSKSDTLQKLYYHTNSSDWETGETPSLGSVKLVFRNTRREFVLPLFYFKSHNFDTLRTNDYDPCKDRPVVHELIPFLIVAIIAFAETVIVVCVVLYLCLRVIPLAKARIQKRGDSAVTVTPTMMMAVMGSEDLQEVSAKSGSETHSLSFNETGSTDNSKEKKNSKDSKKKSKDSKKDSKKTSKDSKRKSKDSIKESKGSKKKSKDSKKDSKNSMKDSKKSSKNLKSAKSTKSTKKSGDKTKSKDKKKDGLKDY